MSLLFGSVAPDQDEARAVPCVAAMGAYSALAPPRRFFDGRCLVAHSQRVATPEDRFERQPSLHGGGRFVLAMDGWLANRTALVEQLALGREPMTDSAIVAAALMRWGDEALVRLHGDFALAWWDGAARRLLLACDRTGGRTLFYHRSGAQLLFASIVATLFAYPGVARILDAEMVARAAFIHTLDLERTCFRDILQLLPGHMLVWTPDAAPRIRRYGDLDPGHRIRFRRDRDYVDAAREMLDRVVGEALRVEGPLVSMLSGGLDSSAVASTAARLTAPSPLHAVTVRPDPASARPACPGHRFDDEWSRAQAVVGLYPNMIAHAAPAAWMPEEDVLRRDMPFTGRPPVHLMVMTWMEGLWARGRALGAGAMLSGLSGNATLSASLRTPLLQPGLADLPAAMGEAAIALAGDRPDRAWGLLKAMSPAWLRAARHRIAGRPAPWKSDLALRLDVADRIDLDSVWTQFLEGDRRIDWRRRGRLRLMERTWVARSTLAPLSLRRAEYRDPLGDVRLAAFCLAIPPDQFTRPGQDRYLARRVLADRLPQEIVQDHRVGIAAPEWFDWLSRNRPWLVSELDGIEASALGAELIDVPRLRNILDDWPSDADAAQRRYQSLMGVLGRGVAIGSFIRWAEGANH